MFVEGIVIGVGLCVGGLVKTSADDVGDVRDLATLLLKEVLQEFVTFSCLGKETFADNDIHFFGSYGNALFEAVNNLNQQTAIDISAIDNIFKL